MPETPARAVLVTGATSGIGAATASALALRGYRVFATYRSPTDRAALEAVDRVHPIRMDVTVPDDVERARAEVADLVGTDGLYALVNNAGTTYSAPFEYAEEHRARHVMEVNLMAPFRVTHAFLPMLRAHGRGREVKARVVNVASWAGLMASPYIGFYNASKFGLIGLTESMYYDLRLVDVHAVLAIPGITRTPLLAKTTEDGTATLAGMTAEGRSRYGALLEHYATMSASSASMPLLADPERVAGRLVRIVERRRPRFRNHLGLDARLVDRVVTRLPWRTRVALNRRMYALPTASAQAG